MGDNPFRLGQVGQIYVTELAARAYARRRYLPPEEARRELTEFLLEATRVSTSSAFWRRRTEALDVSACVAHERGLAIVTAVTVHVGPRR